MCGRHRKNSAIAPRPDLARLRCCASDCRPGLSGLSEIRTNIGQPDSQPPRCLPNELRSGSPPSALPAGRRDEEALRAPQLRMKLQL
jgi:hypothetical protein